MFINLISISSICFSCLHHSSFEMISLSSYVAWQFTYVTFCLDHWYLVIQWTLFNISSWNLCLPFLSLTTTFSLKTVLCLVFLKICLNCLHCCELTTIWLVWLCAFKNGFRSEVKQLETHSTGNNQLLDCSLISLTEGHASDPVQLLELKRNTESIAVWTKKLSERKVCCDTVSLFSSITNHKHFKAISLILDTCQKLVCLIAINRSYVHPSDKKSAHR